MTTILDEKDPIKDNDYRQVSSPGIVRPLKKDSDYKAAYNTKIDISFYSPWQGKKELVAILVEHDTDTLSVQPIEKGITNKNAVKIERKLIALVRPHIDF